MNIRDLGIFQTVVREKSYTRASRLLYMTPQGISKVVKNLEQEYDCELLYRSSTGIELTESGRCFLEYADEILKNHRDMKNELLHIQQKKRGAVDLLSAYGILRLVTPECLLSFRKKYPEIAFSYREFPDRQVERLFLDLEGNVAFSIGDFEEDLYYVTEMERFPIKLLVNEKHPLSERASVTIQDLKGEPLYIESSEFKLNQIITDRCKEAGFTPDVQFETSGFSLCHKMVKANKGISVTVDFVFDDMKEQGLRLIPFSDGAYEWKVCMLTRKGEPVGEAVGLFQEHVSDWMRQIREGRITR